MVLPEVRISSSVIVLDLDDTLYSEAVYQESGFREVARWIERIYGKQVAAQEVQKSARDQDILGAFCSVAGLPETVKQSLLWIYRLHEPDIALDADVHKTIVKLERESAGVAILTDGRSVTQRLKLRALGLSHLPAYISEEFGDEKPSPLRFRTVMQDMPSSHYVYVADNPAKDFIAPNQLGWLTVGVTGGCRNVHSQKVDNADPARDPIVWIPHLSKLFDLAR